MKKNFFHCLAGWVGKTFAGNFMKWIYISMKKKIFFTVWLWRGGGLKIHLNPNCRKFHEMDKSMKKKFTVWLVGGNTPEPKLQEIS